MQALSDRRAFSSRQYNKRRKGIPAGNSRGRPLAFRECWPAAERCGPCLEASWHDVAAYAHASAHNAPLAPPGAMAASGGAARVLALDFDGVVCDSVGESSLSAFKVRCKGGYVLAVLCAHGCARAGPRMHLLLLR